MKHKRVCPTCGGTIERKIEDFDHPKRGLIPQLPYEKCLNCDEILFGPESYRVIRSFEEERKQTA